MKNWFLCFFIGLLCSCSDGIQGYNNPYLPNYSFAITINKNLPLYSGLNSPINPIIIREATAGITGIIAMKISDNDYLNGLNAKCSCDNFEYSIFTGLGNASYPMKPYRIEVLGDLIRIYN